MSRITAVVLTAAVLLAPGCKSFTSSADPVARDQEIIRDILWRYQREARFDEVRVTCEQRVVTLTGRVADAQAKLDAEKLARVRDVGTVYNRIDVRAK